MVFFGLAAQFFHRHAQAVGLALAEIVVDVVHQVVVHHFVEEIVDVEFGAAIHDGLYLREQFAELQSECFGDVVECHLTVNALNNLYF